MRPPRPCNGVRPTDYSSNSSTTPFARLTVRAATVAPLTVTRTCTAIASRSPPSAQSAKVAAVNQSPVTLAALKRLGEILADLHGQHEHQSLLRPDAGIEVLDRLGRLENERDRYAATLGAWRAEGRPAPCF